MKIYVVIEDIDDYYDCGGGEYPCAVFLNYANAERYAQRKQREANAQDEFNILCTTWRVETWETIDERENNE